MADAGEEGFEFVAHTADIAVRLRAGRLERLFDMAARALTETITDREAVRPAVTQLVTLEARELDLLLVDWLNELLYLFETRDLLVRDTQTGLEQGDIWRLRAEVRGETRDPARHAVKVLVKAVTYHGLEIVRTERGYEATLVFDV